MRIRLDKLGLRSGAFALDGLDLDVADGAYAALMGRTGCGKSTLIETICGLREAAAGRVWLGEVDVTQQRPADRGIGYVPQDGALFPTMTVREHLEFPLVIRKQSQNSIAARASELAEWLGLRDLLDRRPEGLSGGERQRVALGRALSYRPNVLLLDEPLSALDDEARVELHGVLSEVSGHTAVTVLHVTHNRADAEALADVIHVLSADGIS